MLYYLKFHFKQQPCGEEHQYTTSPFFVFLKKTKSKKQKNINISYLIIVLIKNEAINILGFKSMWNSL